MKSEKAFGTLPPPERAQVSSSRTCLKGTFPVSSIPIMTMRATQKKRMSWPVSRREVG